MTSGNSCNPNLVILTPGTCLGVAWLVSAVMCRSAIGRPILESSQSHAGVSQPAMGHPSHTHVQLMQLCQA